MIYDRPWLEAEYTAGSDLGYLLFWGHQPARDGSIGASCFSQWWPADFTIEGTTYPSAEHWMMAEKARLFGDDQIAREIIVASSPKQVKALGRQVKGFVEPEWDREKRGIVARGNLAKFAQNAGLRDFLLSTGDRILVEASPVDRIWGIGLAADDANAHNPLEWRGENLLGFVLMDVRDELARSPARPA
ncbi:NADAR family protein [Sphingomonas colocasiae]|uniref:NADAR family protein n=1 Tax=Sphingomonas colocasiae TaxID=1848973 RepID=A0ABS7PJA3_9SPHN|nr:NADAR family protein [Sphingomonas colocasiae]MBY8821378.1 NADAR family protein [Sphingomonas colocasiae]